MSIWEWIESAFEGAATEAFLALLLAGHMLGDFVFQSRSLVEAKRDSIGALVRHAAQVTLCHLVCLLPFLAFGDWIGGSIAVGLLGLVHLLIDRWKIRKEREDAARGVEPRLRWWVVDQVLHLASVLALVALSGAPDPHFIGGGSAPVAALGWTVAVFAFNVHGAGAIVGVTLDACERRYRPPSTEPALDEPPKDWTLAQESKAKKGAVIGILERMLILVLILAGEAGAIGFVLAAKSVARFKDMEERDFSEGYLVGTLTSTLIAVLSGLLLRSVLS